MNWRQSIMAALLVAAVCCGVMWWLEDFRQQKIIDAFKEQLGHLPTVQEPPS